MLIKLIRLILIACTCVSLPQISIARDKEAMHYEKLLNGDVQCLLCPRECVLAEGEKGYCRVRMNKQGKLVALTYAQPCSVNIDPVEKKPLFHFLPGTPTLSIATAGCNLRCVFCQNWSIAHAEPEDIRTQTLYPKDVVRLARKRECPSISYTYSEPTVFYEYMYDTAWLAKQHGVRSTIITCGYINPLPLEKLCEVIDATHVDLKGFTDKTYRLIAAAKLKPLLDALRIYHKNKVWLEVGYLVIPGLNDGRQEISAMCAWVVKNLGPDVPVHFLRFFPNHKLTKLPPTPVSTLEKAAKIAQRAGVRYVYVGNVPGHELNHTYCHHCGKIVIKRKGYFIEELNLVEGKCRYCGQSIPGIWK